MPKNWTPTEKDELAEHLEYEIRKLAEYVADLEWYGRRRGGAPRATGQALLEASLVHLRVLDEFLRPRPKRADGAYAGLWVTGWAQSGYLTRPEYGRVSAKVAHLSHSRLRYKLDDWEFHEIPPLAARCFSCLDDFFRRVSSKPPAFVAAHTQVVEFLDARA